MQFSLPGFISQVPQAAMSTAVYMSNLDTVSFSLYILHDDRVHCNLDYACP